ncbi:MAG: saccharopine dehydrogenase family protein [Hyphomicrobiaceae bacterium]
MKIVIVGGYGAFGRRLVTRLCKNPALEIVIAGRHISKAETLATEFNNPTLFPIRKAKITAAEIDAEHSAPNAFRQLGADVVVNASGPFQAQDYTLAKVAIRDGCHIIDLADAREFVTGIGALDQEATAKGVCVLSGASTVPALSAAVVQHYRSQFAHLKTIKVAISPGNHFHPGIATTASILGYVGHPIKTRRHGRTVNEFGWQGLAREDMPGLGKRWMGYVDVPDLDLFPQANPDLETVEVKAGLEVGLFHIGLWTLSWLVRAGLVTSLAGLASPLLKVKQALSWLGSDAGGMTVVLRGLDHDGNPHGVNWTLAAYSGDGPNIPTLAAQIFIEQLAGGKRFDAGARPCMGVFSLKAFEHAVRDLDIQFSATSSTEAST